MRFFLSFAFLILLVLAYTSAAQQKGAEPVGPPLLGCGAHGKLEVLCGTTAPEDLELTPDGKYLIATQFLNQGRVEPVKGAPVGGGMTIFDIAKKSYSKMAASAEPDKSWGDPACPGPIGEALISHGSSLAKRKNGAWALYVVNHGGRESIEMYELRQAAGTWAMVWRGCHVGAHAYNDVAILPDGGFVASYPSGLAGAGGAPATGPTGYVARWIPGKGESEVMGTRMRGPNGVSASADGRYIFVNEFQTRIVHKMDLNEGKEAGSVMVDFLPDNLTWTKQGRLLAAGVKGARGECPEGSGRPCIQGFGVAEIDPAKMQARTIFDSATHEPLIAAVSVAFKVDNAVYVGAFRGDRLVKIPYKGAR